MMSYVSLPYRIQFHTPRETFCKLKISYVYIQSRSARTSHFFVYCIRLPIESLWQQDHLSIVSCIACLRRLSWNRTGRFQAMFPIRVSSEVFEFYGKNSGLDAVLRVRMFAAWYSIVERLSIGEDDSTVALAPCAFDSENSSARPSCNGKITGCCRGRSNGVVSRFCV